MRTTIDLPEPLHRIARSLALHTGRTLSETVAELVERGLAAPAAAGPAGPGAPPSFVLDPHTGLPVSRSARAITPQDVSQTEDEA
jgi:hypothetical protein